MKRVAAIGLVAGVLIGCGEEAPTVGDAPISKGIESKPMPKPPGAAAANAARGRTMTPGELSQLRKP